MCKPRPLGHSPLGHNPLGTQPLATQPLGAQPPGERLTDQQTQDSQHQSDNKVNEILDWVTKGALIGSVKNRPPHNSGVRLKPPTFNGQTDPKHFFVKLLNYLETYKVHLEYEKIRVLRSCLEGSALDLYLSLTDHEQGDLTMLEKTFQQHFRPISHAVVETEAFMKMKKRADQSVAEFYTALQKKANELLIEESIVRITLSKV